MFNNLQMGHKYMKFNMHLDHGKEDWERVKGAKRLMNLVLPRFGHEKLKISR